MSQILKSVNSGLKSIHSKINVNFVKIILICQTFVISKEYTKINSFIKKNLTFTANALTKILNFFCSSFPGTYTQE